MQFPRKGACHIKLATYATRNDGKPLFESSATGCTKEETKTPECAARGRLQFSVLFLLLNTKKRETLMEMRPKMKCNLQHSVITCPCCVSTKMPHSGPKYFVQSFDTLSQSLGIPGETMFLTDMLPDANTCAPVDAEVDTLAF